MANPNRTVYLARNRRLVLVEERDFQYRSQADDFAAENKGDRISRVTSFKLGPRNKPTTRYMVRFYIKGE